MDADHDFVLDELAEPVPFGVDQSIDRVDGGATGFSGEEPPKIRKNFPESWIWELFEGYD